MSRRNPGGRRRRPRTRECGAPERAVGLSGADGVRRSILQNIAKFGWSIVSVHPGEPAGDPAMSYTVGLIETFQHPELIVFGISVDTARAVIHELGSRFFRLGQLIPLDEPIDRILEGFPVILKSVPSRVAERNALIAQGRALERGLPFSLVQVVRPDPHGHFPWEDTYDRNFDALQPRRYETVSGPAGTVIPLARARRQRLIRI